MWISRSVQTLVGNVWVPEEFDPDELAGVGEGPFSSISAFGPTLRVSIDDPWLYVAQTAGADQGDHNVPTRGGTWMVTIEALADIQGRETGADPRFGDARFVEFIGRIVDFVIWSDYPNSRLVYGCGIFSGKVDLNSREGDGLVRDAKIVRHWGGAWGKLHWADMEENAWYEEL